MEIFDAVKFKKLFSKVKEHEKHDDVHQLGITMATTGKVDELLKKTYQELSEALKSLTVRVEDVGKLSEHLQLSRLKISGLLKVPDRSFLKARPPFPWLPW